jgi:hypothetical protein
MKWFPYSRKSEQNSHVQNYATLNLSVVNYSIGITERYLINEALIYVNALMTLLVVSSAYNLLNVNVTITSGVSRRESTLFKTKFMCKVVLPLQVKRCLGEDDAHQVAYL